jgi:hypothetical protein
VGLPASWVRFRVHTRKRTHKPEANGQC